MNDRNRSPGSTGTVPFVSILIPTKNVAPYIDSVVRALLELDYPEERYEIFVLDGYSTDGTKEIVMNIPGIHLRQNHCPIPAFYNRTLPEIKGEIVAFGDGDAVVDPGWLRNLVPHLTDPRIAGAGGLCLTANGEQLVPRAIGYELKARYERMPAAIERIATMNVVYKKSILLEVGGFDENLEIAYDTEIGHRIRKAGYGIRFVPEARVYHYHRQTLASYFLQQFAYGKNVPRLYLKRIHIAAGDAVTPLWMNIQPFLYALTGALLLVSPFIPYTLAAGMFLILILALSYAYSAIRIAVREKDAAGLFVFILYFIRGTAWTLGGLAFVAGTAVRLVYQVNKACGGMR